MSQGDGMRGERRGGESSLRDEVQGREGASGPGPSRYAPPRIVKKRAVSRATLFTGSGPDGGGVVGAG